MTEQSAAAGRDGDLNEISRLAHRGRGDPTDIFRVLLLCRQARDERDAALAQLRATDATSAALLREAIMKRLAIAERELAFDPPLEDTTVSWRNGEIDALMWVNTLLAQADDAQ